MLVTANTFTDTLISLVKATAALGVDTLTTAVPVLMPLKDLFITGTDKVIDLVVDTFSGTTITDSNV